MRNRIKVRAKKMFQPTRSDAHICPCNLTRCARRTKPSRHASRLNTTKSSVDAPIHEGRLHELNTPVHLVGSNDTVGNIPVLPTSVNTGVMSDVTPQMLRTVDPRDYWINPANRARADSSRVSPGAAAAPVTVSRQSSTSISSLYPQRASSPGRTSSVSSHSVSRSVIARPVTRAPAHSRAGQRH